MRSVWRLSGRWDRRLPVGLFALALLGLALPSGAMAQSSIGRAANTATALSVQDAVQQQQNELMNSSGVGSGSGAGVAIGAGAAPTGRLRTSDHDALKTPAADNFAWDTREGSVFGTVVYALPGTVLGGNVKVSLFGGHNWLALELKDGGGGTGFSIDQYGKARNESVIVGGTALWSQKNTYALATLVGMWGETSLTDSIDDCGHNPPDPIDCVAHKYSFNTSGFISTGTIGQVFPLSKSASGPMLDLRGSVSHTQNFGETFLNYTGDSQRYKYMTWTGTGAATLYSNITLQNSALLRPYIQGYVRQEFGYSNKLHAEENGGGPLSGIFHFKQAHTYGGVDVGTTYTLGNMTLGAAAYYDMSADDHTLGGRLGASWKLN